MDSIIIRPAQAEDMKFILATWLRTWRTCPWAGTVRNDQIGDTTRATIEGLVIRGANFLCAVHEPTGRIVGWVCHETLGRGEACVHYLYLKDFALKIRAIGTSLLAAVTGSKPGFFTHRFHHVTDFCSPRDGWKHAPEIARRK